MFGPVAEEEIVGFITGVVEGQSLPEFFGVVFDGKVDEFVKDDMTK